MPVSYETEHKNNANAGAPAFNAGANAGRPRKALTKVSPPAFNAGVPRTANFFRKQNLNFPIQNTISCQELSILNPN